MLTDGEKAILWQNTELPPMHCVDRDTFREVVKPTYALPLIGGERMLVHTLFSHNFVPAPSGLFVLDSWDIWHYVSIRPQS